MLKHLKNINDHEYRFKRNELYACFRWIQMHDVWRQRFNRLQIIKMIQTWHFKWKMYFLVFLNICNTSLPFFYFVDFQDMSSLLSSFFLSFLNMPFKKERSSILLSNYKENSDKIIKLLNRTPWNNTRYTKILFRISGAMVCLNSVQKSFILFIN